MPATTSIFADVCLSVRARIPDVAVWCHPNVNQPPTRTYALPIRMTLCLTLARVCRADIILPPQMLL